MKIREFVKSLHKGFNPMTSSTALRAFENDIIPVDVFIYKSMSARSLDIKPYSIKSIEFILPHSGLDFATNIFLVHIFEEMIHDRDQERALFAAENINMIENRYIVRIEKLKKEFAQNRSESVQSELAQLYHDLALLNSGQTSIMNFYFKQSYDYLKLFFSQGRIKRRDLVVYIEILIAFKLFDQACNVFSRLGIEDDPSFLTLRAKIEFFRRDYRKASMLMQNLKQYEESVSITEEQKSICKYWIQPRKGAD